MIILFFAYLCLKSHEILILPLGITIFSVFIRLFQRLSEIQTYRLAFEEERSSYIFNLFFSK